MSLKNRNNFPPDGYPFYQAQTNWSAEPHRSFNDTVGAIIAHRNANARFNLPTDRASVEADLENFTCQRLRERFGDAGAAQWVMFDGGGGVSAPFSPRPRSSRPVGAVVDKAKKAMAGIGLVMDWLGEDLVPVDRETANQRGAICVGCEFNQDAKGMQKAYELAAASLTALMNTREDMKLSTDHDDRLKTCQKCDCVLKLKVFAPIKHIDTHTSKEVYESLPGFCWIKKEIAR